MHTIYIGGTNQPNIFHVGQTDRTPEARWNDGDYGKLPYVITKVNEYQVPKELTDGRIHRHLIKSGKIFRTKDVLGTRSDEIFIVSEDVKNPIDYIQRQVAQGIHAFTHGINRQNSYAMRNEQKECHDKAVEHYRSGGTQFLINAKMRFGKTFTAFQIAKTLQVRKILVLTYKPAVNESWREEIDNHVDFHDWHYHSTKDTLYDDLNPIMLDDNGTNVLFTSFQDFNKAALKSKWQLALDYSYDLVIIDEMHYGSDSDLACQSLSNIKTDRFLFISGTPLAEIFAGTFAADEIYTWSYAQEQACRRLELDSGWQTEVYRWLPEMQFHTYEVNPEAKKVIESYDDSEGFTMTKMFGSNDGKNFIEQGAVKLFLDQVFGITGRSKKSPIKQYAPDHMLMVLPPSVKAVNAMCNLLEHRVGDQYKILNVSGDNITDLSKVKTAIAYNSKTITVSCGRFNTGVTVPEWDMVLMLDDGKSAETYYQTIFRVQNPDKTRGKEICYVVDYNVERLCRVVHEYAALTAKLLSSTGESLRELLEFAPILDHSGNRPVKISAEDVLSFMSEIGEIHAQFGSTSLFRWHKLHSVEDILNPLNFINLSKKSTQLVTNDIDTGSNYDQIESKENTWSKQRDKTKELRAKAIALSKKLPTLLLTQKHLNNVDDIMRINNPRDFECVMDLSLTDFRTIVENGFINKNRLDRCIHSLRLSII